MTRCSICNTMIRAGEALTACPECTQEYHAGCWTELGGCATYGCRTAPEPQKAPPPARVGGGWGDEKTCPECDRTIASSLLRCTCGARFPYADPLSKAEWSDWVEAQATASGMRKMLVILFILSLLGLPALVLGPVAGICAFRWRRVLGRADGTYLAMGYGAAALGATYLLILLPLAMGL